jgi:site-specific DNA-methyltransferase (adenine-specific)
VKPYYQHNDITIYHGNALHILPELPAASVSCLLTDPPYSSGGCFRSDRARSTGDKYVLSGTAVSRPDFAGDNRDQRSWTFWCAWWLSECLPLLTPGAHVFSFTDWRQLPSLTDAMQAAGFVWRGIIPWNKTPGVRPQKGWFRAQCEYVLTASAGNLGQEQGRPGPCMDGFWTQCSGQDKHHQTGKPASFCRFLLEPSMGGMVLDPFMGGGTTLFAARDAGRPAIGIEIEEAICEDAAKRLAQDVLPLTANAGHDRTSEAQHNEKG